MPRKITPLVTGEIYHVFNRGVDKRITFIDDSDYLRFYKSLAHFNSVEPVGSLFESVRGSKDASSKKLVTIHTFCLLPNHFHILLTQETDDGISNFMKRLGGGYTSYFNEKYERSGSLFQGKFKRILMNKNEKLLHLSMYINYNHLVHGLNDGDQLFKSSRAIYGGTKMNTFISPSIVLEQYSSPKTYTREAVQLAQSINPSRKNEKAEATRDASYIEE
jgi:REP element-mobilizing transposase RayT